MAKTASRTHHTTSSILVGSHVSKSQSQKRLSTDRTSTAGQDPVISPGRGSAPSPAQHPKKVDYKSPNVRELTKELVTRAKKPKLRLSNANHPVRRRKPKAPTEGIFQQGRQRPTGPVRTFIVFKASSKHHEMRRRKPKRTRIFKLPSQKRFSAVPVYEPRFYNKSELKGHKIPPKLRLSDQINVQGAETDVIGAPATSLQSGAVATGAASATSHHSGAPIAAERSGTKKTASRALSAGSKGATKATSGSSSESDPAKLASGMEFEKKAHVGGTHQVKAKRKKKRFSISILQKKPVRRRSHMYKLAKVKPQNKRTRSKASRAKEPAALALSRKSLLATIRPGFENTLKDRIVKMQRMKKIEKDEK